jgi:hypothetical protein
MDGRPVLGKRREEKQMREIRETNKFVDVWDFKTNTQQIRNLRS